MEPGLALIGGNGAAQRGPVSVSRHGRLGVARAMGGDLLHLAPEVGMPVEHAFERLVVEQEDIAVVRRAGRGIPGIADFLGLDRTGLRRPRPA